MAYSDSNGAGEEPSTVIASLDVLDTLLLELFHDHTQPEIVTQNNSASEVRPTESAPAAADATVISDIQAITDAELNNIDDLINSIVSELLIDNKIT